MWSRISPEYRSRSEFSGLSQTALIMFYHCNGVPERARLSTCFTWFSVSLLAWLFRLAFVSAWVGQEALPTCPPGNRFQHERRRLPGLWRPRPRAFPSCNLVTNRSLSALKRPGAVCWPEVQYLHNWRVQLLTPKAGFLNSVRLYALQPPVVA